MIFLVVSHDIFRFFINNMKIKRFIGGVYQGLLVVFIRLISRKSCLAHHFIDKRKFIFFRFFGRTLHFEI
ncbi:hypothetical protein FY558_13885 [Vibrio cholerae]|nr:hypothetical protein [Vibrio cholerae]KAA1196398.1 hypothetical protein F0L95_16010 [Vibrio cholerae]KAA1204548.1 hypothetical protein F0M20_11780 [Vibrio cholerae]KAA1207534.1 hypothetical protein F0Q16_15980 [Vibrio cholerae]KAA1220213.1 hypothetical protein F0M23_16365 [Vibrio cholerae]